MKCVCRIYLFYEKLWRLTVVGTDTQDQEEAYIYFLERPMGEPPHRPPKANENQTILNRSLDYILDWPIELPIVIPSSLHVHGGGR